MRATLEGLGTVEIDDSDFESALDARANSTRTLVAQVESLAQDLRAVYTAEQISQDDRADSYAQLLALDQVRDVASRGGIQTSNEGLVDTAQAAMTSVASRVNQLAGFLGSYFSRGRVHAKEVEKRLAIVEKRLHAVERSQRARSNILKPKKTAVNLIYLDDGFDRGLKRCGSDMHELLKEQKERVAKAADKYGKWLVANHAKMLEDRNAIDSLTYDPKEFIAHGGVRHDRSLRFHMPKTDMMFFRGKQIPGGMALYTEAATHPEKGHDACLALAKTSYWIEPFDTQSYSRRGVQFAAQVQMKIDQWAPLVSSITQFLVPLPGAGLVGLGATYLGGWVAKKYHQAKAKIPTTSDRGVKITKDMLFYTLTYEEMIATVKEVRRGLDELRAWRASVVDGAWYNRSVDEILDQHFGLKTAEVYDGRSINRIKDMCIAVLNINSMGACGVDAHALKVYYAMLAFVDQSLAEYES